MTSFSADDYAGSDPVGFWPEDRQECYIQADPPALLVSIDKTSTIHK